MLRFAVVAAAFVALTLSARIAASQTAADRIAAARTEIRSRNLDSAMALLRQVADSPSAADPSDRAVAFMWLGIVSFYEGDDSATAKSFQAALALNRLLSGDELVRVDSTLALAWKREQADAWRRDSVYPSSPERTPVLLRSAPVPYPEGLRQAGVEGRVLVQAIRTFVTAPVDFTLGSSSTAPPIAALSGDRRARLCARMQGGRAVAAPA